VAVIETVAKKNGTQDLAVEYLKYLYTKEAQEIIAKNYYRPTDKEIAEKYAKQFPTLDLISVTQLGGWSAIQKEHFDDNGVFDKIYGR
jgi:sulfate transport system substrate-binding protein